MTASLMVSVDLDDAWAYQRVAGYDDWRRAPTVLPVVTERYLSLFDELGIRATVFAIGADADTPHGAEAVRAFAAAGHEIANHSWSHRGELPRLPMREALDDLSRTHDIIGELTGSEPRGFRCPSFGSSGALSAALDIMGYDYDASGLPTSIMPLLRILNRLQHGTSTATYGSWRTSLGPQRPRRRHGLIQVPTTTMPFVRLPAHGSYLSAIAGVSPGLANAYLWVFDALTRLRTLNVSFLLHASDVIDRDDAPQMQFFPGMKVAASEKRERVGHALEQLSAGRFVEPIGDHVSALLEPVRT